MKVLGFAFLCAGAVAAGAAEPKCKMTGMAYPPSLEPLPDGTAKTVSTYIVVSPPPLGPPPSHTLALSLGHQAVQCRSVVRSCIQTSSVYRRT